MFTVRWEESALNELARLWLQANPRVRPAITAATHEIDRRLQADPQGEGESRPGNRRILFVLPLGTLYRLEADGQTVSVLRV